MPTEDENYNAIVKNEPSHKWSNLTSRFYTALIFSALCIPPFILGGFVWAILVSFLGGRMLWEWVRMSDAQARALAYIAPLLGGFSSVICLLFASRYIFVSLTISTLIIILERARRGKAIRAALGFLYICVPCLFIIFLRDFDPQNNIHGLSLVLTLVLTVVASDTGAYFGGSYFKGPKIAPLISPKKTWSGFISGLLAGMIVCSLTVAYFDGQWLAGCFWALPIVLLSVIGDFIESFVKRRMMVKDTGGVLPGHGGLLDRFDSLILVIAVVGVAIYFNPNLWPL